MIRSDIKKLYDIIEGIGSKSIPFYFTIYILDIQNKLKPYAELYKKLEERVITEEYKKYDTKRIDILRKHAKKDSEGEPIVKNGNLDFDDISLVQIEIEKLNEEYESVIESYNKNKKLLNDYMEKTEDINIEKVSIEDFPDELIEEIDSFLPIIED
jgi:hypothetical protein